MSDAGHGVGDGDARQTAAAIERRTTDAGYGVGDNRVFASCNKLVRCRLDNGIAIIS